MRGYRFIPLGGQPQSGVVLSPEGRAFIARFLTPAQAKAEAQRLEDDRQ